MDIAQNGAALDNLASAFGVPRDKAQTAADALVQSLSHRIERNTLSRGGVADVVSLLGDPAAGLALADPQHLASPAIKTAGDGVLDVLIGDKHISRGIAARAAKQSGLDASIVERMLPVIASLVVGGLQRQAAPVLSQKLSAFPGIGDLLPMPGGAPARAPSNGADEMAPRAPRDLRAPPAGSGGQKSGGGVILPMPSDSPRSAPAPRRTGYDDLSDVIRKGPAEAPGGGSLDGLIRSILGGLLGFKNRGFISSIIFMLLSRFGLNILRRILGGVLGRR